MRLNHGIARRARFNVFEQLGLVAPGASRAITLPAHGFLDITRPPDHLLVQTISGDQVLANSGGRWTSSNGIIVITCIYVIFL